MTRLKIDLVSESFYPVSDAPSVRMTALAKRLLLDDRFRLKVFTSKRSESSFEGQKVVRNWMPPTNNRQSSSRRVLGELLFSFETLIRLMFSRRDVVLITSPPFLGTVVICAYLIIFRKKYIIDVRDYYPAVYFEAGLIRKDSVFGRRLLKLEKWIYRHALFVTGATQGLCDGMTSKTETAIELFRNGFDEDLFAPAESSEEAFQVVFHGSLSKFQDIEGVVALSEALLQRDEEIQVMVIGAGSQDYLLKDSQLPNLNYLGKRPYKEVAQLIARASLGISLRKEGVIGKTAFPVKVYEYIGVGLPMICTPHSEAGDFLEAEGIGFQYRSNEIEAIADKIVALKQNKEDFEAIRERINSIRSGFSRESLCDKVIEKIYSRVSK